MAMQRTASFCSVAAGEVLDTWWISVPLGTVFTLALKQNFSCVLQTIKWAKIAVDLHATLTNLPKM